MARRGRGVDRERCGQRLARATAQSNANHSEAFWCGALIPHLLVIQRELLPDAAAIAERFSAFVA